MSSSHGWIFDGTSAEQVEEETIDTTTDDEEPLEDGLLRNELREIMGIEDDSDSEK